ncbi:UNVERIFIED_CONTAM: putative L-type lectin-domain containing receptor kinase S.5 [Sesamum radiatum]|uniref:non-specific serine/threonine protein kinase n=1 Tax=Sesamum radiatum TaxID=300843 RepID=A0AAW2MI74_SESRA
MLTLLLVLLIHQTCLDLVESKNFSFSSFDSESCENGGNLICLGSVKAGNGSLSITPDQPKETSEVGRVLFRYPMQMWPASFSTTFTIRITSNSTVSGDGMAFIIAQDNKPSPPESYGSFIGIMDPSTEGGLLKQLAVELDTYKNPREIDNNHIAIDSTSVDYPVAVRSLNDIGINLKSGRNIKVKIEYDGRGKILHIYVAYAGECMVDFLSHEIIMQDTVPQQAYVGFTGSTGHFWEETKGEARGRYDIEMLTKNAANAPKLFTYKQLSRATRNFSKENLLGTGGFGSVYKGVLSNSDSPTTIAVKKINATSTQGEKEYLAEICTIGRLRHKNLVQLQGWCHEREQLLLVYEYMPNGSLDQYIGKNFLDWKTRYKILSGLASVLLYLHEECDNPVVHRDVKPNNVMLDSDYNAHLGDFGLARLLQNNAFVTTMVAGTIGYLAPEVSFTGRATPESDVYSFGMVVLEVVCGRRSKGLMEEFSLVDCVWNSYEKGLLLSCVDHTLRGDFDEEQVKRILIVGLACLHPDQMLRPRMRKVVQIFLNSDEPLMKLPESRPTELCLSLPSSSPTNTTSDLGCMRSPGAGCSREDFVDEISIQYEGCCSK